MPDQIAAVTVSTVPEQQLQQALLQAVGFDRLNPAQRELALAIARQYGLDPMLRHLVIVEGKPYITRDGLLHVAHKSGVFDGIEVDQPTLDEDGKYWRTWGTVYRKDMSRPFRYPGRYPATGGNAKYNEEMCIKVAEVMTLRRAFDVAAPVIEERWDGDLEAPTESDQPVSVMDKIAARAAAVEASGDETGGKGVSVETAPEVSAPEEAVVADPDPEPATIETPTPDEPEAQPVSASDEGPTLAEFGDLVKDIDPSHVKRLAKAMFPDIKRFSDLTPSELGRLLDQLAVVETAPTETAPNGITLCGEDSPYGDGKTCTMDRGHGGAHHAGVSASW